MSAAAAVQDAQPRVRAINVTKISLIENDSSKAAVVFEITGDKLGKAPKPVVKLFNQETGVPVEATVVSHDDSKLVAGAQVPVGKTATKYVFQVTINNADVFMPDHLSDFTLELKREPKKDNKKADPFEITFETFKSEQKLATEQQ